MNIRLVISGRSYPTSNAALDRLALADDSTVNDALAALDEQLTDDAKLPPTCLVALSGKHLGTLVEHESCPLRDGDELVVIAPVAGG